MYSMRSHVSNGATFGDSVCIRGEAGKMRTALPTDPNSDPEDGDRSYPRNEVFYVLFISYYLLTPWSRVLLEKLTGSAASQEIPRFFGTRMFITVLTSSCHLSLS